ncbi:SIMPL domain-containing protein [Antarcticimicrobium luteum]|uniref:SIMPL domain-containing protein n=1 Tax=Antarcticimicrobium luteum TaxID=2547397 RepID=UPI001FDFD525|nr:SIMPL domain-containing protein [Antarcticimicrobium luteum]
MTPRLIAAALIATVVCALPAVGGGRAEEPARRLTVTGEGRVEAAPDMATITLGVTHEAKEAGAAMRATSEAVAKVLDRLAGMGIAPRDLQTRDLSLSPLWSDPPAGADRRRRITGFAASNAVSVRVRDLAGLGAILDAVIADGANDFNGLRFDVQEPAPLMDEARRRAVDDAMARAALLAGAAGVTLGPVLSIDDQGGSRPMPMAEMAMRASPGAMPVAAGELSVTANVSMVFAIRE